MKALDATHATLSKITHAVDESKETTSMKLAVEADYGPHAEARTNPLLSLGGGFR